METPPNPEDPGYFRESIPRSPPREVSLGIRVSGTPALGLILGFALSVIGLAMGDPKAVHDISLALVSGALGMFAQIFRPRSNS